MCREPIRLRLKGSKLSSLTSGRYFWMDRISEVVFLRSWARDRVLGCLEFQAGGGLIGNGRRPPEGPPRLHVVGPGM